MRYRMGAPSALRAIRIEPEVASAVASVRKAMWKPAGANARRRRIRETVAICLGIVGQPEKVASAVPNKVYQMLLSGRSLGFAGIGIEQSPSALQLADVLAHEVPGVRITSGLADIPSESQDYLAAFKVLEHIEDDWLALSEWTRHLRSGGEVLLSVPAHPVRWNPADVWAGHFRRYT